MNLTPHEWCRCFEQSDRPCAAVRRRLTGDLVGKYFYSMHKLNSLITLFSITQSKDHMLPIVTFKAFINQRNAIVLLECVGALINMVLNLRILGLEENRHVVRVKILPIKNKLF